MSPAERMLIEHECGRLSISFAHLNDAREFAELSGLFAPDGIFVRPLSASAPLVGPQAILGDLSAKPPTLLTRHLCMNVRVEVDSAEKARGTTSFLTLVQRNADPQRLPMPFTGEAYVGEYRDEFVLTPAGWRIARREGHICFEMKSGLQHV